MGSHSIPSLSLTSLKLSFPVDADFPKPPSFKEFRRVCSTVIEGSLYVSGWLVAGDLNQLSQYGITHIINTAANATECPFLDRFEYLDLAIQDTKSANIQSYFYTCIDFIESAISDGGRVLIHCVEGVSRSCTVAIAYLMWRDRVSYVEGQRIVESVRPICQPNTGFICQLLDFGKRLANPSCQVDEFPSRLIIQQLIGGKWIAAYQSDRTRVVDPRFPYIQRSGTSFTIRPVPTPGAAELALSLIDQIGRIEGFLPTIDYSSSFPEEKVEVNPLLHLEYETLSHYLHQVQEGLSASE